MLGLEPAGSPMIAPLVNLKGYPMLNLKNAIVAAVVGLPMLFGSGLANAAAPGALALGATAGVSVADGAVIQVQSRRDIRRAQRRADRRAIRRAERRAVRRSAPRYRGYRGYSTRRPGYRRYNGFYYPPAAFIAGAIIGNAISSGSNGLPRAHYNWCDQRYRSYDARSDTFQPYNGPRQRCNSPYDGR